MNLKITFYILLWLVFIAYSYVAFPYLNDKVMFPVGIIIGTGAWLFNRTTALLLCLLALIHQFINYEFFADIYETYQNRLSAPAAILFVAGTITSIRSHLNDVRNLNTHLDHLVKKRNIQLKKLNQQLIKDSEQAKILNSQKLHDGMGQQLTGIQLLCSSLADNLLEEKNPLCAMSNQIGMLTTETHNQIRRISRLLFPVKIGKIGLTAALQELASCMTDLKSVNFSIIEVEKIYPIAEATALQIYRICQDLSLHAIEDLKAKEVTIELRQMPSIFQISMAHNSKSNLNNPPSDLFGLIKYRLQTVTGSITTKRMSKNHEICILTIPNHELLNEQK